MTDTATPSTPKTGRRRFSLLRLFVPESTGVISRSEFWTTLAHADLKSRYRGSVIGPWWLTIATGIMVAGIGFLYGGLFNQALSVYLPYICVSLVVWTLISTCINEAVVLYTGEGSVLRQTPVPATVFVSRLIYRNLLVFAHNAVIIAIVLTIFPPEFGLATLMSLVGLVLLMVNLWWISFLVALLGARYRDVVPIVGNVVQILFFVTPIIWRVEDLPGRAFFVTANPAYHLIEVVRAPLLTGTVPWTSLGIIAIVSVLGCLVALRMHAWSRSRLVYWL